MERRETEDYYREARNGLCQHNWKTRKTGPEVIKLFPCSAQHSMKFFLLINAKKFRHLCTGKIAF